MTVAEGLKLKAAEKIISKIDELLLPFGHTEFEDEGELHYFLHQVQIAVIEYRKEVK